MKKLKFNISASALKLYKDSPLQFYYSKIIYAPEDTNTVRCYGLAGTVVHKMGEDDINGKIWDVDMQFQNEWKKNNLDKLKGFNGKVLDYNVYLQSALRVVKLLETKYTGKVIAEQRFEFPLVNNDKAQINLKGFIDAIHIKDNGDVEIIDWKTNSKKEDFSIAAKMYFLLYYKQYNVMPKRALYEYVKIDDVVEYKLTKREILAFEKEIKEITNQIISYSSDINNFPVGNWDSPFNSHRLKCEKENIRRSSAKPITVILEKNRLKFDKSLPLSLKSVIRKKYSYMNDGVEYSEKFQSGQWDGKTYMFKWNSLPIGLLDNLKQLIKDFSAHFSINYQLIVDDRRNKDIMNKTFNTVFKKSNKTPRDYQEYSKNVAIEKKNGVIYLGTGLGKTFIASNIIRQLNKRTLFLVNRIELVKQAKDTLEEELGVSVGVMVEGKLDISNQITVAGIQTIYAILKRENSDSILLNKFLYNVAVTIYDECQNLSNSGMYGMISRRIVNSEYILGLSGTPFRNGPDTLEMNSLVGFPITNFSTKWGEDNGWLCPTKCFFIKHNSKPCSGTYTERYNNQIVNNVLRNKIIKDAVEYLIYNGKQVMVLAKSIEHMNILNSLISESAVINSTTSKKRREQIMIDFKSRKLMILIAGVKIGSAGLDIPALDSIVVAGAHRSIIDSIQLIGRVKRKYKNKKFGYLIDIFDNETFFSASMDRIKDFDKYDNDVTVINGVYNIDLKT